MIDYFDRFFDKYGGFLSKTDPEPETEAHSCDFTQSHDFTQQAQSREKPRWHDPDGDPPVYNPFYSDTVKTENVKITQTDRTNWKWHLPQKVTPSIDPANDNFQWIVRSIKKERPERRPEVLDTLKY